MGSSMHLRVIGFTAVWNRLVLLEVFQDTGASVCPMWVSVWGSLRKSVPENWARKLATARRYCSIVATLILLQ
jgi:hypothetical protein